MPQSDQNAAQSSQSNAAQSSTSTTTSDQSTSTQNNAANADQNAKTGKNGKLPQTATPLPLLALLGLGSLTSGIAARRKK